MTSSREVVISPEARRDIRSILRYTLRDWGIEKRDAYASRLKKSIDELSVFPMIGIARDDVAQGLRTLKSGHHLIYYRLDGESVIIVRVLHERMDAMQEFVP
jgi:toxin ParE1/3/4